MLTSCFTQLQLRLSTCFLITKHGEETGKLYRKYYAESIPFLSQIVFQHILCLAYNLLLVSFSNSGERKIDLTSDALTVNASATVAKIEVFDYGTTVFGFNVSVGKLLTIAFKEISEVAPLQDLQIVKFVTGFHLISMYVVR